MRKKTQASLGPSMSQMCYMRIFPIILRAVLKSRDNHTPSFCKWKTRGPEGSHNFPSPLLTGRFIYIRLDCVQLRLFPAQPPSPTLTPIFTDFLLWVRLDAKVITTEVSSAEMTLFSEPGNRTIHAAAAWRLVRASSGSDDTSLGAAQCLGGTKNFWAPIHGRVKERTRCRSVLCVCPATLIDWCNRGC